MLNVVGDILATTNAETDQEVRGWVYLCCTAHYHHDMRNQPLSNRKKIKR